MNPFQYIASLKQGGSREHAEQLVHVDVNSALDMYVERGEWDECLKQAAKQSVSVLNKYVALYAAKLVQQGFRESNYLSDCQFIESFRAS